MTEQIFISYSKKDSAFAYKLADDLEAAGFKIWIDRSIGGGDLWRETIEKNLRAAGEVIIVVSPNSMASEWVKHEGSLAYGWGKKLYPVLIEKVETLPPWLEEYQWVDFVKMHPTAAFDLLVTALAPPNPIQDLLDQQVQVCRQTGDLIGEAILRVISENRSVLVINYEAQELIARSQQVIDERIKREQQLIAEREEARRSELQKAEQIRQLELYVAQKKAEEAEEQRRLEEIRTRKAEDESRRLARRSKYQRYSIIALAILSIAAMIFAYQQYLLRPRPLTGELNIVVAEFPTVDQNGRIISAEAGKLVSEYLFQSLDAESAQWSGINVEIASPQTIGAITSAEQAAAASQTYNAQIIFYGRVVQQDNKFVITESVYYRSPNQSQSGISEIELILQRAVLESFSRQLVISASEPQIGLPRRSNALDFVNLYIGCAYYAAGQFESASNILKRLIQNSNELETLAYTSYQYTILGMTYLRLAEENNAMENLETAHVSYTKALQIDPSNLWALNGLADVELRLATGDLTGITIQKLDAEHLDNAYETYQKVIALAPSASQTATPPTPIPTATHESLLSSQIGRYELVKAHFGVGDVFLVRGLSSNDQQSEEFANAIVEYQKVITDYEQGDEQTKEFACHAYARLSIISEHEDSITEAVTQLKAAITLCDNPDYKATYSALLGDLYIKVGETQQAIQAYTDAVSFATNPDTKKKYEEKLKALTSN